MLLLGAASPVHAADFEGGTLSLTFTSKSISKAVTGGGNTRGPALALLKDDTVLLGGGRSGGELRRHAGPPAGLRPARADLRIRARRPRPPEPRPTAGPARSWCTTTSSV